MSLEDRFAGSLLGLALGDAMGAPHEGGPLEQAAWWLLGIGKGKLLRWTDDTQMAMGLAESLIARRGLDADHVAAVWAERAEWKRGYGGGARRLLARIASGEDWRTANRAIFPDGSWGNGAAMRAAPLGLFYHADCAALEAAAELAASVTHAHPLGLEGGVLIARATAMALEGDLDLAALAQGCRTHEFRSRLELAGQGMSSAEAKSRLGASVEAHRSAVTAVHAAKQFDDFGLMMEFIVSLGGDTDTIGAMAGGIFGALHGLAALPVEPLAQLEARSWIEATARELFRTAAGTAGQSSR